MVYVDLPGRLALAMEGDNERRLLAGKLLASGLLIGWISIAMNENYEPLVTLLSGAILINCAVLLQRCELFSCNASLVSRTHLEEARRITTPTKYVIVAFQLLFFASLTWLVVLTVHTAWEQIP